MNKTINWFNFFTFDFGPRPAGTFPSTIRVATALLSFTPLIISCRLAKSFPAFHDLSDSKLPVLMAQSNVPSETVGFGDLDLKKGVDHDLKLEKGEVWNKI